MFERTISVSGQEDGSAIKAAVSIGGELFYKANLRLTHRGNFITEQVDEGKIWR